jgi:hypothetical protein
MRGNQFKKLMYLILYVSLCFSNVESSNNNQILNTAYLINSTILSLYFDSFEPALLEKLVEK